MKAEASKNFIGYFWQLLKTRPLVQVFSGAGEGQFLSTVPSGLRPATLTPSLQSLLLQSVYYLRL